MTFKVTPSDQVVIDWSEAGPDDALRVYTIHPRQSFFCMMRVDRGHKYLRLVPGAIPGTIRGAAYKAARELIGSCSVTTDDAKTFEQWLEEQPGSANGLLSVVAERVLAAAYVRGGQTVHDALNIGASFVVQFSDEDILPARMGGRIRDNLLWTSSGTIVKIEPVPRFAAVMHAAARY